MSVGCDDCRFIGTKECGLPLQRVLSWRSHKGTNKRAKYKTTFCFPDDFVWLLPRLFFKKSGFFDPLSAKSVKKLDNFHRKKRFFDFFLR